MGLFSVFDDHERNKKLSHLKSLVEVAFADGKLETNELQLLESFASKLGLTMEDVQDIKNNPDAYRFNPPSSDKAKILLLYDLVKVMLVDNEIHEKEVEICKSIAVRLNILPRMIDEMIAFIIENGEKEFDDFFSTLN